MIGRRLKSLTSKLYIHFSCVLIGQPWLAMEFLFLVLSVLSCSALNQEVIENL